MKSYDKKARGAITVRGGSEGLSPVKQQSRGPITPAKNQRKAILARMKKKMGEK